MGRRLRYFVVLILLGASVGSAQTPAAAAVLREMAANAGVIFSGQVVAVTREDAAGFVDIRFRIEQCVRACPRAGSYTLREWAGLWGSDPGRFSVGQRRLMLLTARGKSGMSSPLGGMDGAIPLVATGVEPIADQSGVAPADTAAAAPPFAVDLRWIEARAQRSSGGARANADLVVIGRPVLPSPEAAPGGWEPIAALSSPTATAAAALPSLASIVALLGSSVGASDARF